MARLYGIAGGYTRPIRGRVMPRLAPERFGFDGCGTSGADYAAMRARQNRAHARMLAFLADQQREDDQWQKSK